MLRLYNPLKLSILLITTLLSFISQAQQDNLIVIDAEYSNKTQVLNLAPQGAQILELNLIDNPWKAIREVLNEHSNLNKIHLFITANYNSIKMGGITYNLDAVNSEFELSMLEGLYTGTNIQLLVYDCNLGSNEEGLALINQIAQKTYFNVGVSTNCTSVFDSSFNFNYSSMDQSISNSILEN